MHAYILEVLEMEFAKKIIINKNKFDFKFQKI